MKEQTESEEQRKNRLKEEIKRLEHLEKLYRFHQFLNQIRYPDITAGHMNRLINIV